MSHRSRGFCRSTARTGCRKGIWRISSSDTLDGLDLGAFHAPLRGRAGRNQPFHPAMMVKVLVYGYATGVFSSRKIAHKLHEDVAFRVLAAENLPGKHRTIRDFRALHLKELSGLFVRSAQACARAGADQSWARWPLMGPSSKPTPRATRR